MTFPPVLDTNFRLDKILPEFQRVFRAALPFLTTRKNQIHTYIAYQYALAMLEHEAGTADIVIPACILHDVGWSTIPEEEQLNAFGPLVRDESLKRKHETEGAVLAAKILGELNYDPHLIGKVMDIVDGHDTVPAAKFPEDAIVKDADKLWRYSEIGFLVDTERFESRPRDYFSYLQNSVDEWFLTGTGRKLALSELHMREQDLLQKRTFFC